MIWWQEQIFPLSECGVWVPEAVVSGFMPFSQHLADPVYLYFGRGFSSAPAATADSHYLVSVCLLDFSHFSLWCQWAWCPYTSERVLLSFPALISVFLLILGKELWVGSVFLQASWIFYIITSSYTQPLQIHHKVNYSLLCNEKQLPPPPIPLPIMNRATCLFFPRKGLLLSEFQFTSFLYNLIFLIGL